MLIGGSGEVADDSCLGSDLCHLNNIGDTLQLQTTPWRVRRGRALLDVYDNYFHAEDAVMALGLRA
jgi:hypothetical protein